MINPSDITKYDRTEAELEEFLLFCILVAGKNSKVQAKKLEEFLTIHNTDKLDPFNYVSKLRCSLWLETHIKLAKLGQYTRLMKCFSEVLTLCGKLSTCTVEDLEAISGIGPKSARFFLTHSRENQKFAVLDTHMLKYLRDKGYDKAPKNTPVGKHYRMWELIVLSEAMSHGMPPADFDLMIWKRYSKNA
jgi:thermostable 8-oxoguanine DNA glycosylase